MTTKAAIIALPLSVCLLGMLLPLGGCQSTGVLITHEGLGEKDSNFILYVSNQSYAMSPIDIRILIDGKEIVSDNFLVKNQHAWRGIGLRLSPGVHKVVMESRKANLVYEDEFKITEKHWATAAYYYSKKSDIVQRPQFKFKVSDKPIYFL